LGQRYLRHEIARRARPLVLEFEILLRAPVRHAPSALSRQLLILHPVRDGRVLAEPAHLVLLIILEITLEPFDMAVALEGEDVRGDTVEEAAIVADDAREDGK